MEPWKRVDNELSSRGKTWAWLRERLLIEKMQTVNHWKTRGIPAKYHSAIEIALKKQPGWVMDLVSPYAPPSDLTQGAKDLGALYDIIPESDTMRRMQALADASKAIMRVLQPSDASSPKVPE